ncbi:TauD/TfdA family dioxygenase [Chromohalobacter beijerinckii]|uniref:TauD/TfdA family dioxygenase n=2 Tax=Chromohalobacter TaxID=42054 RepID=A0ABV8XH15_9GAMM|nr:TauD/TfdA family dioxygenase [Chromohalobacter beijerinckii]MCK0764908.1 TauD/TfdA family dioxygenase [Chromohalobacter beijerinckii]
MQSQSQSPAVEMSELFPYVQGPALRTSQAHDKALEVTWDNADTARYSYRWLRDHCACPECRHPMTRERLYKPLGDENFLNAHPEAAVEDGVLVLRWADGHESRFDAGWLHQRRPETHIDDGVPRAVAWPEGFTPAHVPHAEMMGGNQGRREWLTALLRDGLVLLDDGPRELEEVVRIAELFGPMRATNFGARFDVQSKPNPNNAAYTAIGLELHSDLPNWRHPPDIQLLYCLENEAEGGESLFADGFAVAEALRHEAPDVFLRLRDTPIDFRFQDEDSDIAVRAPVIDVDDTGRLREIRFNNWIRDTLRLPPEEADAWYEAYLIFWQRLREPRFRVDFALEPGQMVAFDNRRVLHGRGAFDPNTGRRHLQGTYLDIDHLESHLRVLARHASTAAPATPTTSTNETGVF